MICNAVHPQAEQLAAAGVTITACSLNEHKDGPCYFEVSANQPPTTYEMWQPQIGDYVQVDVSPECEGLHAHIPFGVGAVYGRVEMVDRTWDDPNTWIRAAVKDHEDVADMLESARTSRGHFYYVSDGLGGDKYVLIDGHHAAAELTPVPSGVAISAIGQLRTYMDRLTPSERFMARIGLTGVHGAS